MNKFRVFHSGNNSLTNGDDKRTSEDYETPIIESLTHSYFNILKSIGEDPNRDGLLDTPERAAKAMSFFTKGYKDDLKSILIIIFQMKN
jgi:GTP cyclohydrolase I